MFSKVVKTSVLGAALLAGSASTAVAQDAPSASEVFIRDLTYGGSGCPAGSVSHNISPDGQAFTILYDQFVAQAGPGVDRRENRKNCQLNLDLRIPNGWSYSVASVDYRGYASLDNRVEGLQKATYYFQGETQQVDSEMAFTGPLDQDYLRRDEIGMATEVWSPCGEQRSLNINSQVRINNTRNTRGGGLLTVDSTDGTVKQVFNLRFRRCGNTGGSTGGSTGGVGTHSPDPSQVRVRSISYAGTGCPAGSVAQNIAADAQAFTLIFDNFVAAIGNGIAYTEQRKNCQLNIDLDFPQGWSFAISDVDYRGYVSLDPQVIGTQKATYYFQGQLAQANTEANFTGPVDEDYQRRDTLALTSWVWSPCGAQRSLNINAQVRLSNIYNRNGGGMMTVDSVDGKITQQYNLQWRRCE